MIVNNFDILRAHIYPAKTQLELIVDPNAVLSVSVAFEGFESVAWRNSKVIEPLRNLDLTDLPSRNCLDRLIRCPRAKAFVSVHRNDRIIEK